MDIANGMIDIQHKRLLS